MRVFVPNSKPDGLGGGWTFLRNFRKAIAPHAQIAQSIEECDVVLVAGPTLCEVEVLREAKRQGKGVVLRVDNVPRKSRNKRSTPHERMREMADLADIVVYQSEWAKRYCEPLTGPGTVIYNGVDTDLFKPDPSKRSDLRRYLYAYHGKNEHKGFWAAHLYFQQEFRIYPSSEFVFIYDFGRETDELREANFDFWQGENYTHAPRLDDPKDMADLMQRCTHLIYPSICDACPNVVLEARACGLEVVGAADARMSGTVELLAPELDVGLARMGEEYAGVLELAAHEAKTL